MEHAAVTVSEECTLSATILGTDLGHTIAFALNPKKGKRSTSTDQRLASLTTAQSDLD